MFLRVRDYIRDRPELVAVTLEPLLMEDRWRGLWNVLSGLLAVCGLFLFRVLGFLVVLGCFSVLGLRVLFYIALYII